MAKFDATAITNLVLLALSKLGNVKVFRNNVGMGYQGKSTVKTIDGKPYVIIENFRVLHAGLIEGSSDLIGWTEKTITPEMVGKKVAIFTAIEIKVNDKATPKQINFLEIVRKSGGISGIAKNSDDALKIVSL